MVGVIARPQVLVLFVGTPLDIYALTCPVEKIGWLYSYRGRCATAVAGVALRGPSGTSPYATEANSL